MCMKCCRLRTFHIYIIKFPHLSRNRPYKRRIIRSYRTFLDQRDRTPSRQIISHRRRFLHLKQGRLPRSKHQHRRCPSCCRRSLLVLRHWRKERPPMSSESPRAHHAIVEAFEEAGLTRGCLNQVQASRLEVAAVTETLGKWRRDILWSWAGRVQL